MIKVATENTLKRGEKLLSIIARDSIFSIANYSELRQLIKNGRINKILNIGDQIV